MIVRKYKFGSLITEENKNAKGKRIQINQELLDDAQAKLNANPSLQTKAGGKFIKSLVQKDYNKKGKTNKTGQEYGAHNVGETEATNIDFGAGKTTVSRFGKLPKKCASRDAFGMLVGDIKRKVDDCAKASKSAVPQVKPVKPVSPSAKTAKRKSSDELKNIQPPKVV